jgi:hypothetical protein
VSNFRGFAGTQQASGRVWVTVNRLTCYEYGAYGIKDRKIFLYDRERRRYNEDNIKDFSIGLFIGSYVCHECGGRKLAAERQRMVVE